MAYALQDEEQFQQSWKPQQPQLGGAPAGGTVGSPVAPVAAAPGPTGSRFISFDRYLAANRDAAAKTGEKLGYDVQQKGAEAKGAIQQAEQKFDKDVMAGRGGSADVLRNPERSGAGAQVGAPPRTTLPPSGPASVGGPVGPGAQAQGTPSGVAGPVAGYSLADATKIAGGTYTGPTNLAEVAPELRGQVESAQRTAAQLGTEQGRRALLMEGMGREAGPYSGGMAAFDEALAGGTGGNRERFAKTAGAFGQLSKWLGDAETGATEAADRARRETGVVADAFKGKVKDFETMGTAAQGARALSGPAVGAEQFVDNFMQNGAVSSAFRPVLQDWIAKNGRTPSEEEVNQLFTGFQGAF